MRQACGQGGSRTLYFVFADVNVRRGLDDVAGEVVDHVVGVSQSLLVCESRKYGRSQYEWHVKSGPRGSTPLDFEASVTECTATCLTRPAATYNSRR